MHTVSVLHKQVKDEKAKVFDYICFALDGLTDNVLLIQTPANVKLNLTPRPHSPPSPYLRYAQPPSSQGEHARCLT